MKKLLKKMTATLTVAVLAFSLTACGAESTETSDVTKETESIAVESTETGSAETAAEYPDVIKIGYQPVANDMMIAIVEGLLDNLGYPYELTEFKTGKDLNNALASGSVDVGYIGTVPVVTGITSDLGYEVFWIDGIITECEGLVVKEGIKSVADLKGRSIGVVTGSTSHYSLISALEKEGIAEEEVTILGGGTTEIIAMWERGDIDAAYIWQPSLEAMIENGGIVIFDGNDSESIGATTAVVHVVNKEFAEKYPAAVSALTDVLASTQEVYNADPDKVIQDVADRLEMDFDMCKTSITGYRWITKEEQASDAYLGGNFAEVLKKTADFLESQASISSSPEVSVFEEAITAEFVK